MVVRQFFRCGGYHIGNVWTMTNMPSFLLPRLALRPLHLSARQKSPSLEWCWGTVGALHDAQAPQPHPARCLTAPSCLPDATTSLSSPKSLRRSLPRSQSMPCHSLPRKPMPSLLFLALELRNPLLQPLSSCSFPANGCRHVPSHLQNRLLRHPKNNPFSRFQIQPEKNIEKLFPSVSMHTLTISRSAAAERRSCQKLFVSLHHVFGKAHNPDRKSTRLNSSHQIT